MYRSVRFGGTKGRIAVLITVVAAIGAFAAPASAGQGPAEKMTGSLTIEHIGGGNRPAGAHSGVGWAEVSFEAFEATDRHDARGSFLLEIYNPKGEVGRVIAVDVVDVLVEGGPDVGLGAFIGVVVSDERHGGHGGSDGHDTGGHDDGHTDGHDTGTDGHDDGHDDGHGGPGDHATGRDRVGQLIAVRVVDGGSPGSFDELAWKWFPAGAVTIETMPELSALCWKVILGGNVVVHTAPPPRSGPATPKSTPML
jgi:hypothetical protein